MKNRMFAALALSMSAGIGDVFEITKRPEPTHIESLIGGYDNSYGRTKAKGSKKHNPAGTKIARMAKAGSIGMRGRISNN